MKPVLGASSNSFSQILVAMLRERPFVSSIAAGQVTVFQEAANLPEQKEFFPKTAKLAGGSPSPRGACRDIITQSGEDMQSWTRRLARGELWTKNGLLVL